MNTKKPIQLLAIIFIVLIFASCGGKKTETVKDKEQSAPEHEPLPGPPMLSSSVSSEEGLREAAFAGEVQVLENYISQNVNVNATDSDGRTALMLAAYNGHHAVTGMLLKKRAQVNTADFEGRTALMYASTGPFAETVKLLLTNGADPNMIDSNEKFTALMFAAAEGHMEVVKLLLENKADPLLKDKDNDAAETFARQNGHKEVADFIKQSAR